MKKYLFKKGGVFNPIKNSKEFERAMHSAPKNFFLYVYNRDNITASMKYWQEAKEKNINFILIEEN